MFALKPKDAYQSLKLVFIMVDGCGHGRPGLYKSCTGDMYISCCSCARPALRVAAGAAGAAVLCVVLLFFAGGCNPAALAPSSAQTAALT